MKKCPYCAEDIQDEAIVCRFCGRDLAPDHVRLVAEKSGAAVGGIQQAAQPISGGGSSPGVMKDAPASPLPRKKKTSQVTWGCLLMIVFFVLAGIIGSFSGGKRSTSANASVSPPELGQVVFAKSTANIRSGPSTSDAVVRKVSPGVRLQFAEKSDDWYRLNTPGGKSVEWIHESVVLTAAEKHSIHQEEASEQQRANEEAAKKSMERHKKKCAELVSGSRRAGIITKVVPMPIPEVYVNPGYWYSMTIDQKRGLAKACAYHFNDEKPYMITIHHGNNGKKLAKWSSWGLKIY